MNAVWNSIADFFVMLFPLFKAIGGYANIIISLLITVGVFGWIGYTLKTKEDKGWNENDKKKYFENY